MLIDVRAAIAIKFSYPARPAPKTEGKEHILTPSISQFSVREKVQTWMTGLVTEVRKKSPSMVHRWMTMSGDQRVVAVATEVPPGQDPQDGQTGSLERIDESATEPSAAGLRSTIKSKLNLNEFYDKLTKTPRDISGLFQRNKRMERHSTMIGEAQSSGRDQLGTDIVGGSEDEDEEDGDDEEEEGRRMGNTSSPKNLNDEDFLFSFEDFSCIAKTPSSASQNRDMMGLDSGCCEEQGRVKPRRLNIGEIGRSASAKHPDSGIDLGSSGCGVGGGGNKRQLLSDIGRRFSEMDESSNCEFRSDSLRQVVGSQPSMQFRPNSVPVSPRPRMILPSQHHHHHRDSSDFSVNMKKRNSLFREYSTQVSGSGRERAKKSFHHQASALYFIEFSLFSIFQSDSSRCSSVESLLESRRPDAETILINLGFGPVQSDDVLSRLPKRFLKPSQVSFNFN